MAICLDKSTVAELVPTTDASNAVIHCVVQRVPWLTTYINLLHVLYVA